MNFIGLFNENFKNYGTSEKFFSEYVFNDSLSFFFYWYSLFTVTKYMVFSFNLFMNNKYCKTGLISVLLITPLGVLCKEC